MTETACPGCGVVLDEVEGPTHRYMSSSPACWGAYGEILAAEYSNAVLMDVHRLSVDAYAVQHPGDDSRQAIQSVGLHLARLYVALEHGVIGDRARAAMEKFAAHKSTLEVLTPPEVFTITVGEVVPFAGTQAHQEKVRAWARSAWDDWHQHHETVRRWADKCLQ
ncbi:MAG: DUF5946 family protein [Pseudomonadota bacterium]